DSDVLTFPCLTEPGLAPASGQAGPTLKQAPDAVQPPAKPPAVAPPELRCPKCHALIYSRKSKLCGQCGTPLPSEMVLTDQQAHALDDERKWARKLADKSG